MMMIMMMIMINLIIMFNIDINNDDIYHRSYGWLDKKNPKTMMNAKKRSILMIMRMMRMMMMMILIQGGYRDC